MAFHYEPPFLDLEIYRLLTLVEASPMLAIIREGGAYEYERRVKFLREAFDFAEVSRIVVSLAAIHRTAILDDRRYYEAVHEEDRERDVGTLIPDETKPQTRKPLRFHEACNKVLHADKVVLETDPGSGALTGRLLLSGKHRGKEWCVELDLRAYAPTALVLTP
jgi:hypothetical protein